MVAYKRALFNSAVLALGVLGCNREEFVEAPRSEMAKAEDTSSEEEIQTHTEVLEPITDEEATEEVADAEEPIAVDEVEPTDETSTTETETEISTEPTTTTTVTTVDAFSMCAEALDGGAQDVVWITGGETSITLTPGTIIYLKTGGNSSITLPSAQIASIKGICIDAGGGSNISITTDLVVNGMFVFGQGSPTLAIHFGAIGKLSKVVTDLVGNANLVVDGTMVDCANLQYSKQGSANVTCNGIIL
jgi:hypothetical protein